MANKFDIWVVLGFKDKASPEMKKASKNVKDVGKAFVAVSAAAVAAAIAMKKVYDFGKQGAAIAQTKASFDRLGISIETLRAASRNTVDDMTLMSSTLTLLAGTSGELKESFSEATPQLLEVAKAANALNPTLGSTAQLYTDIALGVKRLSPKIIDNLGLTLKIGDANAEYARQLGKTVDELTANEKSQALLNDTLRAGAVLIEQAGGDVESLTDEFAHLETELKNVADEAKKSLSPAIAEFVGNVADGIRDTREFNEVLGEEAVALALIEMQTTGTTEAYDELKEAYIRIKAAQEGYAARVQSDADATKALGDALPDAADALEGFKGVVDRVDLAAMAELAGKMRDQASAAEALAVGTLKAAAGLGEMSNAQFKQNFVDMLEAAGANSDELRSAMLAFGLITPTEVKVMEDLEDAVAGVMDDTLDLGVANALLGGYGAAARAAEEPMKDLALATMDLDERIANLTGVGLENFVPAVEEAQKPIEDFASAVGVGAVNAFALDGQITSLAEDGITEFEAALSRAKAPMANFSSVVGNGAANARDLNKFLRDLPDSHTFTLHLNTEGSIPTLPSGPPGQGGSQAFANGGFLPTGGSGVVGEAGMESIRAVPGGVQITPMTTNNFHTTVNTRATSGTFLQDIEQAQARAQ